MVVVIGDMMFNPYSEEKSREEELEGEILLNTLLLQAEEENGFRKVYERIEELKGNIEQAQKELIQIENEKINGMKSRRTKPSKWNWR